MSEVAGCDVIINSENMTEKLHTAAVDQDLDQPDMATITLKNVGSAPLSQTINQGDTVEVKIGDADSPPTIFKGEVVGLEPIFDVEGEAKVIVRAFNKLHRLTRGRRSKTYAKMSDKDIVNDICGRYSLTAKVSGDVNIKYDHVYQHNQTDLEFLLVRAARINYEIYVVDTELFFRKRDTSVDSGKTLTWGAGGAGSLQRFLPRLTSAGIVQEVHVRGWDPDKKAAIVGKATSLANKMGKDDGPGKANPFGKVHYYDVDVPVRNLEEANALAKSKLEELSLSYITGEGQAKGDPELKPGIIVTVACNDTRFGGKYYLTGTTHKYLPKGKGGGSNSNSGYITLLRFRRNAEGGGETSDADSAATPASGAA
jgi:uncharacterized protein